VGYLYEVMGIEGSMGYVMGWGGWKPFVGPWDAFECRIGDYGHKRRKSVFQPISVIFGHRWVSLVARGVSA
jgi:hypothetical protein